MTNFLEYLTCIKGVKTGYLSHENIQLWYDMLILIKDVNIQDFLYFPKIYLLVNKEKLYKICTKMNLYTKLI